MNDFAYIKHDVTPNTPEWLELRTHYRTASEAPIVLGKSPFTSIEKFKLIKAGVQKQFYSKAMQLGHELEDQVRQWANDFFGKDFKEEIWTRDKYLASLDGIDGDTLVEIKVSDFTFNEISEGKVPESYYLQVQQQLYCSTATVGYIVAYSPKVERYAVSGPISLDENFIDFLALAWKKFDEMPLPEGDLDLSDDGEVMTLFKSYEMYKRQADEIKAAMDDIRQQLIDRASSRGIVANGYQLQRKKGAVTYDYKKACADAKVNLDPYKKEGNPTFSIVLPKSPFEVE